MASDPKTEIEKALRKALEQEAPQFADVPIVLERPKQADHGDFSSNSLFSSLRGRWVG